MGRHKKNSLMPSGLTSIERDRWLKNNNFCVCCKIGKLAENSKCFCVECREKMKREREKGKFRPSERQKFFEEDINRADVLGLSYGNYMAMKN